MKNISHKREWYDESQLNETVSSWKFNIPKGRVNHVCTMPLKTFNVRDCCFPFFIPSRHNFSAFLFFQPLESTLHFTSLIHFFFFAPFTHHLHFILLFRFHLFIFFFFRPLMNFCAHHWKNSLK